MLLLVPKSHQAIINSTQAIIAHGLGDSLSSRHDNLPFKVVGVLKPAGTPVDKANVYVSLDAIEAFMSAGKVAQILVKALKQSIYWEESSIHNKLPPFY